MSEISVSFDVVDFKRGLEAAYKKQIPFATARALTTTAKDAQLTLKQELPSIFTLRNKHLQRGIRIDPATKTKLEAAVGSVDSEVVDHVFGGVRTERRIPQQAIQPVITKKVPKSKRPRPLIAKGGRRQPFFIRSKTGTALLVRKERGKDAGLETLYAFDKRVRIEKRFAFEEIVGGVVAKKWENNMIESLDKALKSAK